MPRVTRSASSRVPEPDPPLPAPTTTRALISRSRASSLARSARSSKSGSRVRSRSAGGNFRRTSSVTDRTSGAGSRGQTPDYEYEDISLYGLTSTAAEAPGQEAGSSTASSRGMKRKRSRHTPDEPTGRGPVHPEWRTSDDEEDVDQLLSDNEEPVASTSSNAQPAITPKAEVTDVEAGPSASNNKNSPQRQNASTSPVSSPSLAKLLHATNVNPQNAKGKGVDHTPPNGAASNSTSASGPKARLHPDAPPEVPQAEPLSEYTCPICFFPPTNATLTPCGHICCGPCLFTAVKTTMQRSATAAMADANIARCPVCRAPIPGWDGRGGGVIGLKVRAVFSM